jgi:hypothetical protein
MAFDPMSVPAEQLNTAHDGAQNASAQADAAALAAVDPRTAPRILADIAYQYPQQREVLLVNPATYPALRDWILAQPRPAPTQAALSAPINSSTPPAMTSISESGQASQSLGSKGPGASPLAALAIAAGIVVVCVLIVTATVLADGVLNAAESLSNSKTPPSASSTPPSRDSYAPAPGEAVFGSASVDDAFFTATQAAGFGRPAQPTVVNSTVGEASAELAQLWAIRAAEPTDTTCQFAASTIPVFGDEKSGASTEAVASIDAIANLATSSTVSQSARVFSNSTEASAYITRLQHSVSICATVDVGGLRGSVSSDVAGTITPHAAWIVDGSFGGIDGKLYVVDMRHDNMVIRTEIFEAKADDAAVSGAVINAIQDQAEQNLIDTKP